MPQPVFNEEEALQRAGDRDFLKELLAEFAAMPELDLSRLDELAVREDYEGIYQISHSIKGVAGNLALTGIYLSAISLNDILRLRQPDLLKSCLDRLKEEVERFLAFLPRYLES